MSAIDRRISIVDSGLGAIWGLQTRLVAQTLAAFTNLLDKVASLTHLYLGTRRAPRSVYFEGMWRSRRSSDRLDENFLRALSRPERNLGLLALCDLSAEADDEETRLARRITTRHAATHRFLVIHAGPTPTSDDWLERLDYPSLLDAAYEQMRHARSAIFFLARFVDQHERRSDREETPLKSATVT